MDTISVSDAREQICVNLPGLSWEHAEQAAKVLVRLINEDPQSAGDRFLEYVEQELRKGTEWAIQLAMASVRKVGD